MILDYAFRNDARRKGGVKEEKERNMTKDASGVEFDDSEDSTHGRNEEGDPAHDDEHGGGKVDGENKRAEGPGELYLEPIGAVVTWILKKNLVQSGSGNQA